MHHAAPQDAGTSSNVSSTEVAHECGPAKKEVEASTVPEQEWDADAFEVMSRAFN